MSDNELIDNWKSKRDYDSYKKLKARHKNMVFLIVNRYKAAAVPTSAIVAEAWKLFDDAVNSFDPSAGAKFSTYLNYQLRKMDRYTKKYQNIARIPEALAGKIGDYDRAHLELSNKLKRKPTNVELSKHLGMPVRHIKQLQTSRRSDLFEGKSEFEAKDVRDHTDWLLKELRDELNAQEQLVYDHLIGYKKRKITNKKLLAKKLGMSPGRISQITRSIAEKIGPRLKQHL